MFSTWDDEVKVYNIEFSDGTIKQLTTQELYEYFLFHDIGIKGEFVDFKHRLDEGELVNAEDVQWDWGVGASIYKGLLKISKIRDIKSKPFHKETNRCNHKNKYINEAGGTRFWVCPQCKADLGDA
jgi:hypothetical protein